MNREIMTKTEITSTLKACIRQYGVTDRFRVAHIRGTLHIFLSKAVRQDSAKMAQIIQAVEMLTDRKGLTVHGRHARYTVVPTCEG